VIVTVPTPPPFGVAPAADVKTSAASTIETRRATSTTV